MSKQLKLVKDGDNTFRTDMLRQVEPMVGVDKVLVSNLIEKLCVINDVVDELGEAVRAEGPMVMMEVGTVNNRREELRENPNLTTMSKLVKVLADISMKVARVAKGATSEEDDDGFDNF